jgi:hypothetical protein
VELVDVALLQYSSNGSRAFVATCPPMSGTGACPTRSMQLQVQLAKPPPSDQERPSAVRTSRACAIETNALLKQALTSLNQILTALAAAEQANAAQQAKLEMLTAVRRQLCTPAISRRYGR